jgi:hypothetical protein
VQPLFQTFQTVIAGIQCESLPIMSSSVSSHTSASLWERMVGAAFLCRRRMGETITAGGSLSGSESVIEGVVPRLVTVTVRLGGIA